jgi:hypothetical protein
MPGSEGCPRCGSSLRLSTMLLDMRPPRAGDLSGSMRRLALLGRRPQRLLRRIADAGVAARAAGEMRLQLAGSVAPLLWRLVIPGWPQFYAGQFWQGWFFLLSFLLCLAAAALCVGTDRGSIFLGSAFLVHQTALLDLFHQHLPDTSVGARIRRSLVGVVLLALIVWLPVCMLMARIARPMTIEQSVGPLERGDVVLVNHSTPLRRGAIVVFYQPEGTFPAGTMEVRGHREVVRFVTGGIAVDRILALGGDFVDWEYGRMMVNGAPSPWLPLNPIDRPATLRLTVPQGHVLIIPSLVPAQIPMTFWQTVASVPVESVSGTIYWRAGPPSRMGRIP